MAEIPFRPPEEAIKPRTEFDGGAFTISAFSPSPEGFVVQTKNVLGRTSGLADNRALDTDARDRLKAAMQGELKFNHVQAVKDARTAWHSSTGSEEEAAELENKFYEEREKYQKKGKKLAIRDIEVDGNTVKVDAKLVSFPVYNQFARPEDREALIDLSANAAAAMIVRSKDGRLVIQHRAVAKQRLTESKLSRGNAQFTDIPGASVAGMLDASLQKPGADREAGKPQPIDTNTVKGGILKEAGEELGLGSEDLGEVRIVGLAHDRIKIHDEFLLLADSNLTAEQIREKSRTSNKNKNLGDADFEEKFIDIDGSANSIATLITEVKCPLPPTHAAALVASGYSLVLQEQGKEAADAWKADVEQGVQKNYREIDQQVKKFYDKHPEVLTKHKTPERFWGKKAPARKLHGYDPAFTPEEQGLPSFEDAMVDAGMVPETRRTVEEADLFDVDGVITDPQRKEVIHPEILDKIADRLKSGIPVALNTGRSIDWLKEPVLKPLLERFSDDKTGLENLALIAEFGGTWATFDEQGEIHEGQVDSITVPEDLYARAKQMVAEKYSSSMFDDDTKKTMISIEMHAGHDLDAFHQQQALLDEELQTLLAETNNDHTYEVHTDTIATNIRSPYVGKDLGADRFIEFLRDRGIKVRKFKTYGDSVGDIEMADEAERRGFDTEFIYVGDPNKIEGLSRNYTMSVIPGYSSGTKDYLSRN